MDTRHSHGHPERERAADAVRSNAPAMGVERITYIDGLRGVAIGMVLLFHAWTYRQMVGSRLGIGDSLGADPNILAQLFVLVVNKLSVGVSLFLVLSGFCLSLPLLQRRYAGRSPWFTPSEFFARRCLRILPPYYVVLALSVAVSAMLPRRYLQEFTLLDAPPTIPDVLTHLLLLHNLTPYFYSINGSFWSLGLEWQWYWVFPLALVCCLRAPVATLAASFGLAALWHLGTGDLWGAGALPVRLFEFCCGIVAAQLVVTRRVPPRPLLLVCLLVSSATSIAVELPRLADAWPLKYTIGAFGLRDPLKGLVFTSLVLLGTRSRIVNAALSWRPLVGLGIASYSVYLVHEPVMQIITITATPSLRHPLLILPLAIVGGILGGAAFHVIVERPCMNRATVARFAPALTRLLGWTNGIVYWTGALDRRAEDSTIGAHPSSATDAASGLRPDQTRKLVPEGGAD